MAIKPKLQSLLASANEVTGEERTNLTEAVQDLVDGYGQGAEDVISSTTNSSINAFSNGISFFAQNDSPSDSYKTYHGQFYSNATTPLSLNLSSASSWRYLAKIKLTGNQSQSSGARCFWGNPSNIVTYSPACQISSSGNIGCGFNQVTGYDWSLWLSIPNVTMTTNIWYYVVQGWNNGYGYVALYDENGTCLGTKIGKVGAWHNHSFTPSYGGSKGDSNNSWLLSNGEINLNESLIEVDGVCAWGATNAKTANMKIDFSNPAEFTKVDYLLGNGTQFINTGVLPSNNVRVKGKFYKGVLGNSDYHLFGGRTSGGSAMFELGLNASQMTFRSDYGGNFGDWTNYTSADNYISVDKDGRTTTLNGVTVTAPSATFSSNYPIYLFQWNNGGSTFATTSEVRCYDCEMYQSGVLTRNFIPVYHTTTGVRGMFDSVNNLFHPNAGTGDFSIPSDTSNEINLAEYLASLT